MRIKQTLRETAQTTRESLPTHRKAMTIVIVALLLLTAVGVAQQVETWDNDFEDQNADEWSGEGISVEQTGAAGNYSLRADDGDPSDVDEFPRWEDGPRVDLSEEFTITGVSRVEYGTGTRIAFGLTDLSREGALLVFSDEFGVTFLATDGTEEFNSSTMDSYSNDFANTWVEWEIHSPGDGTVQAKVWEHGTSEPSSYELSREFDTQTGDFRIWSGTNEAGRVTYLDQIHIEATEAPPPQSPKLDFETRSFMEPGQTYPFTVSFNQTNSSGSIDVTENVTVDIEEVTIDGQQVLTLNESGEGRAFDTVDNENVNATVDVTVSYENETGESFVEGKEIVVAAPTVENLEILPTGLTRLWAIFGDSTMFALIVAALLSVPAARFSTSFAGLAVAEMVIVVGWLAGYVGLGIAMASIFMALFIGLNLAENTNFSSIRGRV